MPNLLATFAAEKKILPIYWTDKKLQIPPWMDFLGGAPAKGVMVFETQANFAG